MAQPDLGKIQNFKELLARIASEFVNRVGVIYSVSASIDRSD